jgi:DNA-binding IclR family transcriptional regulator
VRKTHVAFDHEEHLEGVSAVGTSVQEPAGTLYAISIPVPTVRFKRNKKQLVDALLKCRARILEEIES